MRSMSQARKLVGGALNLLGVHVARSLYGRWRRMSDADRERLEPLAQDVKEQALDLRGSTDPDAGRDLGEASRKLADALVESAEADPEVSEIEVRELRSDLARELDRVASGEIKASRGSDVRIDSR